MGLNMILIFNSLNFKKFSIRELQSWIPTFKTRYYCTLYSDSRGVSTDAVARELVFVLFSSVSAGYFEWFYRAFIIYTPASFCLIFVLFIVCASVA